MVSAGLVLLSALLPAAFPGLPMLFASAALAGTGMMTGQVALQNAVGAGSNIAQRTENFSRMALGMSIASFSGPLIAGVAIDHAGFRPTFLILAGLPLITLIALGANVVRVPPPSPHAELHGDRNIFDLLRTRELRRVFIASSLLAMAWDVHSFIVPIFGTKLGLSASQIGAILSAFAVATFTIRVAMRWMVRRFREWQVLTGSMLVTAALFLLFPFAASATQLTMLAFALGLALGAAQPVVMALMHHITPVGRAGEALGLRTTLMNTIQVVLPLVMGAVTAALGMTPVFWSIAMCLGAGGYLTRRR